MILIMTCSYKVKLHNLETIHEPIFIPKVNFKPGLTQYLTIIWRNPARDRRIHSPISFFFY